MQIRIRTAAFLMILSLFFCCGAICEEQAFEIKRLGNINPYADNAFLVHAKEDGELTILIHDNICVYRTITETVNAGETTIHWDGCGYNREKLYEKYYTITAVFSGASGSEYTVSFDSPIDYPLQCLQYALSSSETLYLDEPENWFLEYRAVTKGTVMMEMTPDGQNEPIYSFSIPVTGGKISRKDFKSIAGRKSVPEGEYGVCVYEKSKPDETYGFRLSVRGGAPGREPVGVTGEIMPDRDMTDGEIWEMMMMPSVVIDIDSFKHQDVFENPDEKSRSLGTLHGQTQGLKVIRTEDEWAMIGAWNHEDGSYVEGWVPLSKLKKVYPRSEYGILIDKQKQTMKVFRDGQVIDTLLVSTGRMEKKRLYHETSAGCFLTGYHRVNFSMNGKKYDYVIQYDGGNLLHQTPYDWGQYKKDFTLGRGYLGAKASHACVRIQPEPAEGGLNAYWLFTHIPYHTRVVILDDPEERTASREMLLRGEKDIPASETVRIKEHSEPESDQAVTLTFGGCLTPGGIRSFNSRKESLVSFTEKEGYDIPLSGLSGIFRNDDLTCISLGCPIQETAPNNRDDKGKLSAPVGMEEILRNASVELIQAADERIFVSGSDSRLSTETAVSRFSEIFFSDQTVTVLLKDRLFGFAGCTQNEYLKDPDIIDRRIDELKHQGAERIIMLMNWGGDKLTEHSVVQEAMAHRSVRAGACLVIGNQQGVVQGIDYIEDVPVVYSLGDLLNGSTSARPKAQQGMLVRAVFDFSGSAGGPVLTVIPLLPYGVSGNDTNDFRPCAAPDMNAAAKTVHCLWQDTPDRIFNRIQFYIP